jgi:hypothetical protein
MQDLETDFLTFPLSASKVHVYLCSNLHIRACFWYSLPKINLSSHKDKSLALGAIKLSFEIILCNILFNFVHYVFLLLYVPFWVLFFIVLFCVLFVCTATGCQPNCSGQIYNIKIPRVLPQIVNLLDNC